MTTSFPSLPFHLPPTPPPQPIPSHPFPSRPSPLYSTMSVVTQRVNSAMLGDFRGKTVRLTAKVVKLNGDTAIVEASDKGQVDLHLNRDAHLSETYVEVIGKVQEDLSIKVLWSIDMGSDLDMSVVDTVTKLMAGAMEDEETSIF
ncbi:replication factor A protein 3-domain-containing protein [Mrakia frigida]|uniref:RPA3 domain-containing protein n=1 Tax=Mrakia frigida TaxID=29902 RepID=UPI003FCC117E